jgi:anti-sigma regulatory factor (Ser/Thr protein kinase)
VILAVDEALCNVIEHNYKNSSCGIVKATFKISKKKLSIIIQDSGSEYSFVPPSADEVRHKVLNRTRRGFGQYLVNHLMSAVKLRSSKSKGNVLILEKALL